MSKCKITYFLQCENPDCSTEFEILKKTYDNRLCGNIPMLCPECMKVYKSNEQKKSQIERYANMSEESKNKMKEKISKSTLKRYEDPLEREKSSQAALKRYEDLNEHIKTSEAIKIGHSKMTIEAKQKMHENQVKSITETWSKRREKERHLHGEKIAQGHANMSLKAKLKESENKSKAQIERFAKLTFEDKIQMDLKNALMTNEVCGIMPDKFDADTEKEFYWYMKNKGIRIGYHFYNLNIHPDFYKMFPYNPYSKYNYSSPFHEWDFVIWTYKTPILIDIDGSYHDPKLNNYLGLITTRDLMILYKYIIDNFPSEEISDFNMYLKGIFSKKT